MVDYKYKDLYNKPHIDKQIKIIACDFVGCETPDNKYEAGKEYEGKVYFNADTGRYYKCVAIHISRFLENYEWKRILNENELIVFKNKDIDFENFELSESLCSETELRFGCCEASILKFRIHNTFISLKEKHLIVTETLDGHSDTPFQFGRYKAFSDIPTADRLYRDVTAYDVMYEIINSSAINWYNEILPKNDSKVTMKRFRTSFVEHFGLRQVDPVVDVLDDGTLVYGLVNDDMEVEKTIQVGEGKEIDNETEKVSILKESALSGLDVIRAICEINGCFGHIGRDGKFHYIYLPQGIQGLYPSETLFPNHAPEHLVQSKTGSLYPQEPITYQMGGGVYISANYEDFITKKIDRLQIREKENEIGKVYPEGERREGENNYVIQDNFLVYGKNNADLTVIAKNIFKKIHEVYYRPFECETTGNPCLEVGDPVRLSTRYELIESYILKRALKGIQSLRDGYSADGKERHSEKTNSVQSSIIQLKGKTNTLIRNVDETISEIYAYDENGERKSRIEQNAKEIKQEVEARTKEGEAIKASLDLKITNDDGGKELISIINGSADKIHFGANNMFTVDSPNFSVDNEGNMTLDGGILLTYTTKYVYPPQKIRYVFAETGYDNPSSGGMAGEPFLNIKSPKGSTVISIGTGIYTEDPNKFKTKDTPYFPQGAMIKDAYIESLHATYVEKNNIVESGQGENAINNFSYRIRKSGAFASVYGTYYVWLQKKNEVRYVNLPYDEVKFAPKFSVRTVGFAGNRVFIFRLTEGGQLRVRNTGSDIEEERAIEASFRFDYFVF